MKLKQLEILIAIGQEKGLLGAATKMNLTAPAVAKSISNLEDDLGFELLDRTGYRTVLNDYGRRLAQHGKIITAEMKDARRYLQLMKDKSANLVRINASPAVLPQLLPEAIIRLRNNFPEASVVFEGHLVGHAQQKLDDLLKNEYDVLINVVEESSDLSNFRYEHLVDMKLKFLASKDHPITKLKNPTLEQIREYVCLIPGAMEGLPYQTMKRVFSDNNTFLPDQLLALPTREMVFSLLKKGSYLAIIPYHEKLFEGDLNSIEIVETDQINHGWPIYILQRKSIIESVAIKEFIKVLKEIVEN